MNNLSTLKTYSAALKIVVFAAITLSILPNLRADSSVWGNSIYLGGSTQNTNFNSTNVLVSSRFTAQASTLLDEVAFRTGSLALVGSPNAVVTLRADNGGLPGAVLATTANISTFTANSSIYSSLVNSYQVQEGTVYHLVIEGVGVNVSNSFSTSYSFTGGSYENSGATGKPDVAQARLTSSNGGSTWTVAPQSGAGSNLSAIAARNSATGATVGQAITSTLATAAAGGGSQLQQVFVYDGLASQAVQSITLKLKNNISGVSIGGDLVVRLLDSGGTVLSEKTIVAAGTLTSTAFSDYTVILDTPVELLLNSEYKLVLTSPTSAAGSYGAYAAGTTFQAGANNAFLDGTFGGVDSYLMVSTNGGTSYTFQKPYDLYFSFGMEPIPEPSTVVLLAAAGLIFLFAGVRTRIFKAKP